MLGRTIARSHTHSVYDMTVEARLDQAISISDLEDAIEQLTVEDLEVTANLDQLVETASKSQFHNVTKIQGMQAEMGKVLARSDKLCATFDNSSNVGRQISGRVQAVDIELSRVRDALHYVESVMTLKTSLTGMQDAMNVRDWEKAASYISKCISLPQSLLDGEFTKKMVPTSEMPDYPLETLCKSCSSLCSLFVREFERGAKELNMETVTKYFKLFPLIGREEQGLTVYSHFICDIIKKQSRQLIQSRTTDNPAMYGLAFSKLFENMAQIVSDHSRIVNQNYGPGKMASVVRQIQNEADIQGGLIIDTFWDECHIEMLTRDVKAYAYPFLINSFRAGGVTSSHTNPGRVGAYSPALGNAEETDLIDMKQVGVYVSQMSIMLNRWMLYCSFIAARQSQENDKLKLTKSDKSIGDNELASEERVPKVLADSGLAKKLNKKLEPVFEVLARFFFRRSIEKAFELEDIVSVARLEEEGGALAPDDVPTTSVVEDVILVLKVLINQTLSTGNGALVSRLVGDYKRMLESDFIGMMQRKLRDEAPQAQTARATTLPRTTSRRINFGLQKPAETKLHHFIFYLNNLDETSRWISRFIGELDSEELDLAAPAFNALDSGMAAITTELSNDGIQVLFSKIVNARMRVLFASSFRDAEYLVTGDDPEVDVGHVFQRGWVDVMRPYEKLMASSLYAKLVERCATLLANMIENWLWSLSGRVNELGAIRLDRDISKLVATVSEGRFKMREKFIRVAQIVMAIGLEESDEEAESSIPWALSDDERAKARFIRGDLRDI